MEVTVGSLFSGIGGFDLGFERAGFQTAWRCETESFCRKVLTAKMPGSQVYGDVRGLGASIAPRVDVLVGGFPCQDLSVAGQRRGLDGSRSGLFFEFVRLIRELRPLYFVIENVPGLFTSDRGRDFAVVLRELDISGYVGGWRVLDSQYFGLAQRRERVFLVGGPRRLRECARAVLFESASRGWDSAAGDETGADVAATLRGRSSRPGVNAPGRGGEDDANLVAYTLPSVHRGVGNGHNTNYVTPTLDTSLGHHRGSLGVGDFLVPAGERARALVGSMWKKHDDDTDTLIPLASAITASAGHHGHSSPRGDGQDNLVYALGSHSGTDGDVSNHSHASGGPVGFGISEEQANALRSGRTQSIAGQRTGVRRLTPLECERLQGFPDGWTCLCGEGWRGSEHCTCKDTPRYKALGNAVSVPVAQWIAERITEAEAVNSS